MSEQTLRDALEQIIAAYDEWVNHPNPDFGSHKLDVAVDASKVALAATPEQAGDAQPSDWRTLIVGLPIIRKLLSGGDVSIETFKVSLIPDDVLHNNRTDVWVLFGDDVLTAERLFKARELMGTKKDPRTVVVQRQEAAAPASSAPSAEIAMNLGEKEFREEFVVRLHLRHKCGACIDKWLRERDSAWDELWKAFDRLIKKVFG